MELASLADPLSMKTNSLTVLDFYPSSVQDSALDRILADIASLPDADCKQLEAEWEAFDMWIGDRFE